MDDGSPQTPLTVGQVVEKLLAFDQTLPVFISDLDTDWEIPIVEKPHAHDEGPVYMKNGKVLIRGEGY